MASTYLTRTPSSAGNKKTFTISAWIKRANISAITTIFSTGANSTTNGFLAFFLDTDGFLQTYIYESTNKQIKTNARYRDVNGYYHVILAVDTTQATASNRVKFYVNGEQITDLTLVNGGYPSQNFTTEVNNTVEQRVGAYRDSSGTLGSYWNGVISHYHNIDGTAYDPSAFGSTDATTGEWKINTNPNVTYGTNGFFILKDGNSVTDQSPNTNNFTVAGGTLTPTVDNPSNVFCTLNPLNQTNSVSCINGNTTLSQSANDQAITGTLGFTTGKWYWEMYPRGTSSNHLPEAGIVLNANAKAFSGLATATGTTQPTAILRIFNNTGSTNNMRAMGSTTNTTVGASVTYTRDSDYINVAVDADAGKIWFGKNGTYEGGGDPAAGTNPTYDWSSNLSSVEFIVPALGHFAGADQDTEFNFGNGYFGTTAVSSNSGNGYSATGNLGIFQHQPPTNYKALCTKGLNL